MSWFVVGIGCAAVAALAAYTFFRRRRSTPEAEEEHRLLRQILASTDLLLWRGTVRRSGNGFVWDIHVPTELYGRPLVQLAGSVAQGGLWNSAQVPELPEMTARAERALNEGATEYRHQFQVVTAGKNRWLNEDVTIERRGDGEWSLCGVVTDCTAQREAESARQASEVRLQQVLKRADCLLWHAKVTEQTDGSLQWVVHMPPSELQLRVFGRVISADEPDVFAGLITPDAPEMHARSSTAIRNNAPGYSQEFRIIRGEATFWLSEQVSIKKVGPREWELVGVSIDITARREAEAAQRASEAQLAQMLQRADCLVWRARVRQEPDGRHEWFDTFFPVSALDRRLNGEREAQRPGIWEPLRAPDLPQMQRRSSAAFREGASSYEQEFRFIGYDGQLHWLYEQVSIMPEGPARWTCVGLVTDVTERRQAQAALAAEKERLNVTVNAMEEGVVTVGVDARIQFINRAAEHLLHQSGAESLGRSLDELCPLMEEATRKAAPWPIAPVLRHGTAVDLPAAALARPAHGSPYPVEGCAAPMRDPQGEVSGVVVVFRDITERQRLKAELQRASKLESVGILAGGIAHDFNNILTAILGNLSIASLEAPQGSRLQQPLNEAERACLRARDLTQQLLTFAKGGDPILAAVQLPAILRESAQFALHGSRANCEFIIADGLWPANADRGQVAQIVHNLVLNAVQAMPQGGTISVRASNTSIDVPGALGLRVGKYVCLQVSDTGLGIRADDLAKVFDPYFTTKVHGNGLGLATVYSIIKRHGGAISVQSEEGLGTTFHVWLPAVPDAVIVDSGAAGPIAGTLRGRLLIMDDEQPVRFAAAKLAQRLGLDVDTAADGQAAIALCQEARDRGEPFTLALMDLTVPGGMGGAEALREIRRIQPDILAIVSSGYSSDPVMGNFRAHGFQGVVAKPYSFQELARVLQEVLPPEGARSG